MAVVAAGGPPACVRELSLGQEVAVCGRLDVASVAAVRRVLYDVLDRGDGDLLIHLAQAEVHDATGLAMIVAIHHRAHGQGRRLVLVDVSPRLERLLRASRLYRVLAREPGEGEVTAAPGPRGALPLAETVLPVTDR